jgi:radical SAM protein (TIGR01212 family)
MENNRYYRFSRYLRGKFGCRVYRVPIDAGFTCPTRDGTLSTGGCLYCSPRGSGARHANRNRSIREQLSTGIDLMRHRYGAEKFFSYLQAFTNTYGTPARLGQVYREATGHDDIVGLAVGTRPDCVSPEILDTIAPFAQRLDTWIEYGLQSAHDPTLKLIGRGHTVEQFDRAVLETRARGIKICAHVIIGLPGETSETITGTARHLARLPIDGVKIHLLHIVKGSMIEEKHRKGEMPLLSQRAYVGLVCDFLELLPPTIIIQRLTGEAAPDKLVAPQWALDKHGTLKAIGDELRRRDSFQGKRYLPVK